MKKTKIEVWTLIRTVLLAVLLTFSLAGCGDDNNSAASGDFKDPYEAYGLNRDEGGLGQAMHDKPPKAIAFQPFLLAAFTSEGEPLEKEEITLARGETGTVSLDIVKVMPDKNNPNQVTTGYLTAQVDITLNPAKDGSIFHVYNEVSSKMLYQRPGYPDRVRGESSFKADTIYQIARNPGVSGIPEEDYLVLILGQKGGAGNSGMILCRITGVKL
ncbi:MAG: hypothetical protein RBT41_06840 [Clostridia bacterium]|jgi:hypothetical protein|nr:hypothetical protein [Clostridia bacterium]